MAPIIIGRTPHGEQPQQITTNSVSRRHARLTDLGGNRWQLEDIGSKYGTMVDGLPIVNTIVELDTPIVLGHEFTTSVRELLGLGKKKGGSTTPPPPGELVSVAHLRHIYEDYQDALRAMSKKRVRAQMVRMLPMQLVMPLALGLSGILIKDSEQGNIIKGAITFGVMALSGFLSMNMISSSQNQVDEQFELNQQFQIDYVCPKCKNFFGQAKPYKALLNQKRCPYCKSEFKESK